MDKLDLKPCPFCGRPGDGRGGAFASCSAKKPKECILAGLIFPPDKWNRRAAHPVEEKGPRPVDPPDLLSAARKAIDAWGRWIVLEDLAPTDDWLDAMDDLEAAASRPKAEEGKAEPRPGGSEQAARDGLKYAAYKSRELQREAEEKFAQSDTVGVAHVAVEARLIAEIIENAIKRLDAQAPTAQSAPPPAGPAFPTFESYWGTKGETWHGKLDIKEFARGVWDAARKETRHE